MLRSLIVLCAAGVSSLALFLGAYQLSSHVCRQQWALPTDDLDWLRMEFNLSDADLSRIRALHEGYLPKCQSFCEQITKRKKELEGLLAGQTSVSPEAERKLKEIAGLRAECQTEMLRHFAEVSRLMPPGQGRRYLETMQRLTLNFHEQIEASMSHEPSGGHGMH